MKLSEFEKFCSVDKEKPMLTKSFNQGDYRYATDEYIVIRILNTEACKILENEKLPNMDALKWDHSEITKWQSLTNIDSSMIDKCVFCKGTGRVNVCHECDGDGEVNAETEYSSYLCDCATCNGKGSIGIGDEDSNECEDCEASGLNYSYRFKVNNRLVVYRQLKKIMTLPKLQIADYGEPNEIMRFKFDGGEGLIMPVYVSKGQD